MKKLHKPIDTVLEAFQHVGLKHQLPVIFYRKPNQKTIYAILGYKIEHNHTTSFKNPEKGFVFSRYDNFDNTTGLFIHSGIQFDSEKCILETCQTDDSFNQLMSTEIDKVLWGPARIPHYYSNEQVLTSQRDINDYQSLVETAKKAIRDNYFEKVVLAVRKELPLSPDFSIVETFLDLENKYPRAFISMVSVPGIGTWIGSTPELLLTIEESQLLTIALAGTKKYRQNGHDWQWTQKEFIEQELVTKYIDNCFQSANLDNYTVEGPQTIIAGSLIHLSSSFKTHYDKSDIDKYDKFLQILHPTPATCGVIRENAIAFINKHEGFDREFYAGYLGPTSPECPLELYVNLRCMQLTHDKAFLYSGAGITAASDPEKEYQEILMKFSTIESVVRSVVTNR